MNCKLQIIALIVLLSVISMATAGHDHHHHDDHYHDHGSYIPPATYKIGLHSDKPWFKISHGGLKISLPFEHGHKHQHGHSGWSRMIGWTSRLSSLAAW